jgi:hypothetical protein
VRKGKVREEEGVGKEVYNLRHTGEGRYLGVGNLEWREVVALLLNDMLWKR